MLIFRPEDETYASQVQLLRHGLSLPPLCPPYSNAALAPDDDGTDETKVNGYTRDAKAAQRDLISALLDMDLLLRLRYLLETLKMPDSYDPILDVLLIIARHSLSRCVCDELDYSHAHHHASATAVLETERLIQAVLAVALPEAVSVV